MKEENIRKNLVRFIEYSAIIIFLFILLIIIVPSIEKIAYNMAEDAATNNTMAIIDTVKSYYTDVNIFNEVALPFKVVFYEKEYKFYEADKEVHYESVLNVKAKGKIPTDGSVQINNDGSVTVTNLTFGNFICNQTNNNLICQKKIT